MDTEAKEYFANVIALSQGIFEAVQYTTDITPKRAILRLQAQYKQYRILITELFDVRIRKYRYYVLREKRIEAGFDNSPDPRAIRLKYGRISKDHVGEPVPHLQSRG